MPQLELPKEITLRCPKEVKVEFERLRQNWDLLSADNQKKLQSSVTDLGLGLEKLTDSVLGIIPPASDLINTLESKTLSALRALLDPKTKPSTPIDQAKLIEHIKTGLNDPKTAAKIARLLIADANLPIELREILENALELVEKALEVITEMLDLGERPLPNTFVPPTPKQDRTDLQKNLREFRNVLDWAGKEILEGLTEDKPASPMATAAVKLANEREESQLKEEIKTVSENMNSIKERLKDLMLNSIEYIKLNGELLGLMLKGDRLTSELAQHRATTKV